MASLGNLWSFHSGLKALEGHEAIRRVVSVRENKTSFFMFNSIQHDWLQNEKPPNMQIKACEGNIKSLLSPNRKHLQNVNRQKTNEQICIEHT